MTRGNKFILSILVTSAVTLAGIVFLGVRAENAAYLASHVAHEDVRFLTGPDAYAYTEFYDPTVADADEEDAAEQRTAQEPDEETQDRTGDASETVDADGAQGADTVDASAPVAEADADDGFDRYDIGENADVTATTGESDGILRVYLPAENARISFRHLDAVEIDGVRYHSGDTLQDLTSGEVVSVSFLGTGGQVLETRPVRFYTATGMAAFYVEIRNGSLTEIGEDKSVKKEILYEVVDADGNADSKGAGQMHGRGNQSWLHEDKQPYSINLDSAASILGMRNASKWALLSTPEDYTMMMDKLVLDTARSLDIPHAVDSEYVNLYVDGEYKGVYLLAQRIKNTDGAVQINDLTSTTALNDQEPERRVKSDGILEEKYYDAVSPADISGGYLLEFETDSRYAAADQGFTTARRYVTVHSPEYLSEEEADYIAGYVREAEEAVYNTAGVNPTTGKTWYEYLDAASWIKEFWIQEFYINYDADYSSTYFTKEQGDPLLYAGPCWDYDSCFWHTYYNGDYQSNMLTIRGRKAASWLLQLDAKADYHQALTQYYLATFRENVIRIRDEEIPEIVERIGPSLVMMYDRLGYDNKDQEYVDGIEEMFDSWIDARLAFMDDFLTDPDSYAVLYFLIPENSTHNVVIAVKKGEPVELTERIFKHRVWIYGDAVLFHSGDAFYEDTVLTPVDEGVLHEEYYNDIGE